MEGKLSFQKKPTCDKIIPVNSDNIKYVIRQSVERNLPQSVEREIKLPIGTGKVVGLAGVRRAGKTFLFFHAMRGLSERGVSRDRMLERSRHGGPCWGFSRQDGRRDRMFWNRAEVKRRQTAEGSP